MRSKYGTYSFELGVSGWVYYYLYQLLSVTFFLALLITANNVSALSEQRNYQASNIFSLPLEELLNIQVRESKDSGVKIIQTRNLYKLSASFKQKSLRRKIVRDINKQTLFLIDGIAVGYLSSADEFKSYLAYFSRSLQRIEIYTGESASWWHDEHASSVLNFVTKNNDLDREVELP